MSSAFRPGLARQRVLGFIRQARYNIVEEDGQQGIEITVLQDERGEQFIETGLDMSFSGRGTDINVRAAYLHTGLDDRGSEFRAMVQFGEIRGVFADFYKRLDDHMKYNFNPSVSVFSRPLLIFDQKGHALAEIELDELGAAVAFGREFGRYATLFAGYTRYTGNMNILIGNPELEPFSFDGAELFVDIQLDRLDDRYLPTRGWYSQFKYTNSVESLGADASFEQVEFASRLF